MGDLERPTRFYSGVVAVSRPVLRFSSHFAPKDSNTFPPSGIPRRCRSSLQVAT
jgi:hypothetical protein